MPNTRRIEVGSRLRECRAQVNLSVTDAAAGAKIAKSTLLSYEKGRRTIDAYRLADLCLMYGTSTDYVMFGTHMVPDDLRQLYAKAATTPGPAPLP